MIKRGKRVQRWTEGEKIGEAPFEIRRPDQDHCAPVPEACADYSAKNTKPVALDGEFAAMPLKFWDPNGSADERAEKGDDVIRVSRIGFNGAMDEAVLEVIWYCDGLCGSGSIDLYRLRDGKWEFSRNFFYWVS